MYFLSFKNCVLLFWFLIFLAIVNIILNNITLSIILTSYIRNYWDLGEIIFMQYSFARGLRWGCIILCIRCMFPPSHMEVDLTNITLSIILTSYIRNYWDLGEIIFMQYSFAWGPKWGCIILCIGCMFPLSHMEVDLTCVGSTSMQEGRNMHPMYGVFSPRWEHLEKSNLNLVMMKIHC